MSFSPLAKEAMLHSIEKRWHIPTDVEIPIDTPISELIHMAEQEEQYRQAIERVNEIYHITKFKLPPIPEEPEE